MAWAGMRPERSLRASNCRASGNDRQLPVRAGSATRSFEDTAEPGPTPRSAGFYAGRRLVVVTIGSTVASHCWPWDGRFACLWSGDSRVYLVRDGRDLADFARPHRGPGTPRQRRDQRRRGGELAAAATSSRAPSASTTMIAVDFQQGETLARRHFHPQHGRAHGACQAMRWRLRQQCSRQRPQAACEKLLAMVLERGRHRQRHHRAGQDQRQRQWPVPSRRPRPMSSDDKTRLLPNMADTSVGTQLSGIYELDERIASGGTGRGLSRVTTSRPATTSRSRSCCRNSPATRRSCRCFARKPRSSTICRMTLSCATTSSPSIPA